MFCQYCGKEIEEGSRFCEYCGREQLGLDEPEPVPTHQPVANATTAQQKPGRGKGPKVALAIVMACAFIIAIGAAFSLGKSQGNDEGQSAAVREESAFQSSSQEQDAAQSQNSSLEDGSTASSESSGIATSNLSDSDRAESSASQGENTDETSTESASESEQNAKKTENRTKKRNTHVGFKGVTAVTASSYLPHDGSVNVSTYDAGNAIDSDLSTCWAEGASGSGAGESITLRGNGRQTFSGFTIYAGYQKSGYTYRINARPKKIRVYADGERMLTTTLSDAGRRSQRVEFKATDAKRLTIEIVSVYPGTKWSDCCISEIECF